MLEPRTTAETLVPRTDPESALREEMGPFLRHLAGNYFPHVRFTDKDEEELRRLHEQGFVVHVMRTTGWVNYVYLTWALIQRGLPPVRAVVNLRRWFTKPWRKTAQRGAFDVRFTYARRNGGSGLIFLRQPSLGRAGGKAMREDPFPALVSLARKGERGVFLVPELFVWERWNKKLKPTVWDRIFGSPEVPGFLHSLIAFWRNHQRAHFRVGEPIDLRKFVQENSQDSDEVLARKVRSALHHHLARETRTVFGPPLKEADRLIDETLRDKTLRRALEEEAKLTGKPPAAISKLARTHLENIAARTTPIIVGGLFAPVLNWVFNRIYDGVEVDRVGLERALKTGRHSAIVLCPSHKSHVDYLLLSFILWTSGYPLPVVAAGANLSFFPLGWFLRRGGAFFLRRSFKDDRLYTATFKAYLKKLVHDRVVQEFFPEGGRSRTGKLLPPKLGMFTWEAEAVFEGASEDLVFIPVAIDYEKVVEGASYSHELAGGEKKPEDLRSLLSAPKVLAARYGRIHLTFDEPVSLVELMKSRGLSPDVPPNEEAKRSLIRALGNRVMYGISRVSTVTPHALVSAALLAGPGRGVNASELSARVRLLRRVAEEEGSPISRNLENAPSDPTVLGAIQDSLRVYESEGLVATQEVKGEVIFLPVEGRRSELSFSKNTLMNLVASRSLVATALVSAGPSATVEEVKRRALELSRLFKLEFIYKVGESFDSIFARTLESLKRLNLLVETEQQGLTLSSHPEAAAQVSFLHNLLRDFLEAYYVAALTLNDLTGGRTLDKKSFVKAALETGRAELLAGRIRAPESLARTWLENAVATYQERGLLAESEKKLTLGPQAQEDAHRAEFISTLRGFLPR